MSGVKWFAIGCAVVACAVLGFFLLQMRAQNKEFELTVREADRLLARRDYEGSLDILRQALDRARNDRIALRVLRRVHGVSKVTGSGLDLQYFAAAALQRFPKSEDVLYVSAYATLRSGNVKRVLKLLEEHAGDERFDSLLLEAALRSADRKSINLGVVGVDERLERLLLFEDADDPSLLEDLGKQMGEESLLLDAALLWMRGARVEQAYQIVASDLRGDQYGEVAAMISYDAGHFAAAYKRLVRLLQEQPPEAYITLVADTLARLGRPHEALGYYQQQIREKPRSAWIPYANISQIYKDDGDIERALMYLEDAYRQFPDQPDVGFEYARMLAVAGNAAAARAVLTDSGDSDRGHRQQLLFLRLSQPDMSPEGYLAQLWKLQNQHTAQAEVCSALVEHLLGLGDPATALVALEQHEKAAQATPWSLYMKGVAVALAGRLKEARGLLADSLSQEARWNVRYAVAVVDLARKDTRLALEALHMVEDELTRAPPSLQQSIYLSMIGSKIGEAYLLRGEEPEARQAFLRSLELYPDNFQSRLLLKKLDAFAES